MHTQNRDHILQNIRSDSGPYRQLRTALQIIGDKWSALILLTLFEKPCRFTDIQSAIPEINPRTLTQRLRTLEEAALITRKDYKEFPPRIEYAPTEKAHELKQSFAELKKWAQKYCQD